MDADPHSGEFPSSQVMIDALPLGEVARPHAPLDSPLRHIKDGIEHRSHTQGARASTAFGGGDQIFDPLPFFVSQVAWIDFFVHLPIVPTYEDFLDTLLERTSSLLDKADSAAFFRRSIAYQLQGQLHGLKLREDF